MAPIKLDSDSVSLIAQAFVKSLKDDTEFREFVRDAAREGAKHALEDFFGTSEKDAEGIDMPLQYYLTRVYEAVPDPDEESSLIGMRGVVESADEHAKDAVGAVNSLRNELEALVVGRDRADGGSSSGSSTSLQKTCVRAAHRTSTLQCTHPTSFPLIARNRANRVRKRGGLKLTIKDGTVIDPSEVKLINSGASRELVLFSASNHMNDLNENRIHLVNIGYYLRYLILFASTNEMGAEHAFASYEPLSPLTPSTPRISRCGGMESGLCRQLRGALGHHRPVDVQFDRRLQSTH